MKSIVKLLTYSLVFAVFSPQDSFGDAVTTFPEYPPEVTRGAITLNNEEPAGPITLRKVVPRVLLQNPELMAFDQEIRAREANIVQAGFLPNPQFEASAENFGGQRAFSSFNRSQNTFALSQVILLGGKRTKRVRVASFLKDLAQWDYETKRMDILTQAAKAFADVLGAQEQLKLMRSLVSLAKRVHLTVSERVKAGKVSPIEAMRTKVALSSTNIELQRAQRELQAARKRLAATWGSTNPRFAAARGDLFSISPVPSLESLTRRVSNNPDLARWTSEIAQRQAVVDLEKSRAIPNITLNGGYQKMGRTSDNAFLVGFSIPLMIFNRNQGAIQEAFSRVSKAETNKRASKVRVTTALAQAYQALAFAHSQATTLRNQVLPAARNAFDAINEGYRFGKFPFLNVLDSQRTLFQARTQYVRALTSYHKSVADVERLIGAPVNERRALAATSK